MSWCVWCLKSTIEICYNDPSALVRRYSFCLKDGLTETRMERVLARNKRAAMYARLLRAGTRSMRVSVSPFAASSNARTQDKISVSLSAFLILHYAPFL